MHRLFERHADKVRFGAVGFISTTIDFGLLFVLTHFGMPTLIANIISTSGGFIFSFIANRKFTFKSTNGNLKRQFIIFFIVTLFGIWVLQPLIIEPLSPVLALRIHSNELALFIAKCLATSVTLVWNYLWYSRVVFPVHEREEREV